MSIFRYFQASSQQCQTNIKETHNETIPKRRNYRIKYVICISLVSLEENYFKGLLFPVYLIQIIIRIKVVFTITFTD